MMRKKVIGIMSVILAGSFALVSCANSSGNGSTASSATDVASTESAETDASEEEIPTVEPGEKGTLEYWSVFTGADGTSMQEMVDAYNETNPLYTVNHRAMNADDLYLKLPLAVQSQQDVPDIAINHVERLVLHSDNGYIEDMTPYLADSPIDRANYNAILWDASDIGEAHYGVPLDSTAEILFVNMDLYEEYGNGALDDDVVTWDEIKAAGDACVADEIIPVGIGWRRAAWLSGYGQLDGTMTSDGETPLVNDEKSHQVLDTWREIYELGYTTKDGDQPWQIFLGGQMLYVIEGSWMLNNAIESGVNYKIVDMVTYDPSEKGHWTSSHNFVLPRNDNRDADKTAAVFDFIDFIGENSMTWAKAGQIPARLSVTDDPEFESMPQAFVAKAENSTLKVFTYKYYGYVVEAMDKVLKEIMFGQMSVDDGLSQVDQEVKDLIEMNG